MLPLPPPVADALRTRIRRGVDLAAIVGAGFSLIVALVDGFSHPTQEPLLAVLLLAALTGCGVLGLLGLARWTPIAYIGLLVAANCVYLVSYGTWFGLGAIYVLATTLAFLFLSPRWSWCVGFVLVATPIVVGLLFEAGTLGPPIAMHLGDASAWKRGFFAALTALTGVAVVVSFAVRQLIRERLDIEAAAELQRAQRLERERVEAEIARVRRTDTIAQLAAEVGADIGAALAIIQARARALAADLHGADAVDCLSDIAEATSNAGATMRSLTVFAPDAQLAERGDASEAARALPKLVRRMIPHRIALEVSADDDAWVGIGTTDLARVCANLALNARDAIPERGTISVRVARTASEVVISVRDTGSGMPPDILAQLFQPFFTTKPVGRGTGLGLATTKILVERAHGTISVHSEVGRGTTFEIRLPLLAARHSCTLT